MAHNSPHELKHDAALQLLPWHVQGSLDADETRAVSEHIDDCKECRQQARELHTVFSVAGQRTGDVSERRLSALLGRIDAYEARQSGGQMEAQRVEKRWWQRLRDTLNFQSLALPVGSVAAVLLAVVVLLPQTRPPTSGEYEVHSSAPVAGAAGPLVSVRFLTPPDAATLAALTEYESVVSTQALTPTEWMIHFSPDAEIATISELVSDMQRRSDVVAAGIASDAE